MKNNAWLEFLGIGVFFLVYIVTKNIYYATGVSIAIGLIQLVAEYIRYKSVDKKLLLSTLILVVMGGLTIGLHNDLFIRLKPTLLYWVFALVLLVMQMMGRNLIKRFMSSELNYPIPDRSWDRYSTIWVIFFTGLGCLNLYVALNFSLDFWVDFKLFGALSLMVAMFVVQGILIYRHQPK